LAGQGRQDGASMHWRWRQAQAAKEAFRNIAWVCRDVSGKPNGHLDLRLAKNIMGNK